MHKSHNTDLVTDIMFTYYVFANFFNDDRLDFSKIVHQTDTALEGLKEWRNIEGHKIFGSKLRFQIRLDDFR